MDSNIIDLSDLLFLIIGIVAGAFGGFALSVTYLAIKEEVSSSTKEEIKFSYCYQCEIVMPLKEKNGRTYCANCGLLNFTSEETPTCSHNTVVTRVLKACATCETTATFCHHCDKQLSKPKTDCT